MTQAEPFVVSVVIPVYNAEKFVARAVASALAQPEVGEVVLVEDQSPDQALAVCKRLAAEQPDRVRLFRHPDGRNHGAGPSRNLGIRQARFPFIAFLDADDYYLPNRFARDAELLLADETLDGAYNALGVEFVDAEGERWWRAQPARARLTTIWDPPPPEDLFVEMSLLGKRGLFSFDAATFRRRAFERGGYFSDLRLSQDTLLRMQLAAKCRLAGSQTRAPVAMRGVHGDNRIRHPERMRQAEQEVYAALLAWAPTAGLTRRQRRVLHDVCLRRCRRWSITRRIVAQDPLLLLRGRTLLVVLLRMLFRQEAGDLRLPGFFPEFRRRLAQRLRPADERPTPDPGRP